MLKLVLQAANRNAFLNVCLSHPAVKGATWNRFGLYLKLAFLISLIECTLWTHIVLYTFLSNIHYYIVSLARTLARPQGSIARRGKQCDNFCSIRNCTIPIQVHNVLFSQRNRINFFEIQIKSFLLVYEAVKTTTNTQLGWWGCMGNWRLLRYICVYSRSFVLLLQLAVWWVDAGTRYSTWRRAAARKFVYKHLNPSLQHFTQCACTLNYTMR